jgi:lysyl endopeptidase
MKTKWLLFSLLIICCNTVLSQITTEVFPSKGDAFKSHPVLGISDRIKIPQITLPDVDNSELIKEADLIKGKNFPFRFGKSNEVDLSIKDGIWTKTESKAFWSLIIHSKNAFSLNIIFSELYLTKGSELYLYDEDGTMVYGPITSDYNFEGGKFLSDIIRGENLLIRIISSNEDGPKIKLGIRNIVHGFRNLFPSQSQSQSQSKSSGACNNNIECFNDWRIESNAVARVILTGGESFCSGSLINNTSSTFHPYFLTAFHCIDIAGGDPQSQYFEDGTLQQFEIDDVYDMTFQFDYKYTTCGGSTVASYQTCNHATFKSAWNTTDFALVELNSLDSSEGITLLGWDRTGNTPTEGICIHHPAGDVMKISFDDDNLTETSWDSNSGSNYWRVIWDNGVVESGSSGSPLLDQKNRIVGQLKGGYSYCGSGDLRVWYGCFYRSWTGGGTNTTRLSNWLDPTSSGVDTLNSRVTLTGSDYVCSFGGSQYSINDFTSGDTITWSYSDNITMISSQGSNPCTFEANQNGDFGAIAATLTSNSIHYPAAKSVWVGKFNSPSSISVIYGPCIPFVMFGSSDGNNPLEPTYHWNLMTEINAHFYSGQEDPTCAIYSYEPGYVTMSISAVNECGNSDPLYADPYLLEDCNEKLLLFPNPATDNLKIELTKEPFGVAVVEVFNSQSVKMMSTTLIGKEKTINVSKFQNGIYYVNVKNKGKITTGRFIKE